LCGGLPKVDVASSEASSTVGCLAAVNAIRILSRQQCGRDLVEEFLCAKVVPLLWDQVWFDVRDDAKYAPWGLKFLKMRHRVHTIEGGEEVATDEDDPP